MNIGIVGHFGLGTVLLNGQTIKTKQLAEGIERHSDARVIRVDSRHWYRHPLRLLSGIRDAFAACDAMIMLPAQNGVRLFAPVFLHCARGAKVRIYYSVIGGWLPDFLEGKPFLRKTLRAFDGIWVETSAMKEALENRGFANVAVIPNFKNLSPLSPGEGADNRQGPMKLCTFSRVMKEKGIETAVEAVEAVNRQLGRTAFTLDIYGAVASGQEDWFRQLQKNFPEGVAYGGGVAPEKTLETLKEYNLLLFPTKFFTEGIPGTILDAYFAGVPVVASRWENFGDVIDEGVTGLGYPFEEEGRLRELLLDIAADPGRIRDMGPACLEKAKDFSPERIVPRILEKMRIP